MLNDFNRPLEKDVDVSTMLEMRNQGMSNHQISERLGVTYKTVLRYIGKQPKSIPREHRVNNFDPVVSAPVSIPVQDYKTVTKPVLRVVSTRSTLEGDVNKYIIDTSNNTIEVSGLIDGILDKPTLESLIKELSEIKSIFNNIGVQQSA